MRFAPGRELELEGGRGEASGLAVVVVAAAVRETASIAKSAESAAAASSARQAASGVNRASGQGGWWRALPLGDCCGGAVGEDRGALVAGGCFEGG